MRNLYKKIILLILFFSLISCEVINEKSEKTGKTWTLMFYANGDSTDLEQNIVSDVKEMELANVDFSSLKVVVLLDRLNGGHVSFEQWTGTKLFEISYNPDLSSFKSMELSSSELGIVAGEDRELNLGEPLTLSKFIEFSKNNYQADYYSLVIGSHGNGWYSKSINSRAISFDDSSPGSVLSPSEIKDVINGKNIDVLLFDACTMGTIETVYELKDSVEYLVATPKLVPENGFDYQVLLENLSAARSDSDIFSKAFLKTYAESNPYDPYLYMRYDCKKIDQLVESGIPYLIEFLEGKTSLELSALRGNLINYHSDNYIEINDLISQYDISDFEFLLNETVYSIDNNRLLSIYWPTVSEDYDVDYDSDILFSNSTGWDEFIKTYLGL